MIIPTSMVIDASVGIKLLITEDNSDAAENLMAGITEIPGSFIYAPDLFYTECANVLWKYVQRCNYPEKEAQKSLDRLYALGFKVIESGSILAKALQIAVKHNISIYDACYVATSVYVSSPLVTSDERLFRQLDGTDYQINLLTC
jgi:predicted nucleic acid-binding protein